MSKEKKTETGIVEQPEWERAKPAKLPEPTYWPFFFAMGLAFIFWGFLTTWVVLLAGILIAVVALIGWINIMRHE